MNADRSLLHTIITSDSNAAVRRLAVMCLKNGSPQSDTIVLLEGIAGDDEQDRALREASERAAAALTKKTRAR